MRVAIGLGLAIAVAFAAPADHKETQKKAPLTAPSTGIKTPGVQIPFASLKSELAFDLETPAAWIAAADAIWIPAKDSLRGIDPKGKENRSGEPVAALDRPCAGMVSAFNNLWIPNCGKGTIVRADAKSGKISATAQTGDGPAMRSGIAASADSVWALTDAKG